MRSQKLSRHPGWQVEVRYFKSLSGAEPELLDFRCQHRRETCASVMHSMPPTSPLPLVVPHQWPRSRRKPSIEQRCPFEKLVKDALPFPFG